MRLGIDKYGVHGLYVTGTALYTMLVLYIVSNEIVGVGLISPPSFM